jgi:hypothetical protein
MNRQNFDEIVPWFFPKEGLMFMTNKGGISNFLSLAGGGFLCFVDTETGSKAK